MKTPTTDQSNQRYQSIKGLDLFGVCDFCAKHDIEAVDLTGYFFPGYPNAPADSYLNRMKRCTHDRGIAISGTGVKNDDLAPGVGKCAQAKQFAMLEFIVALVLEAAGSLEKICAMFRPCAPLGISVSCH